VGNGNRQLGLKYHRKTAKPKLHGVIDGACRLFTLKVRGGIAIIAKIAEIGTRLTVGYRYYFESDLLFSILAITDFGNSGNYLY
jgi:hypothetical protein